MDGILPIYKPTGVTSYDVIRAFKRIHHPSYKIGHGGTLDPFADGVLLLLLGKATKKMNELMSLPKTYQATAILGVSSDTLDRTGILTQETTNQPLTREQIALVMQSFVGKYEQEIPDYSAAKVDGKPRYILARNRIAMDKKTKPVTIHSLTLEKVVENRVTFLAKVSSGTYVRQLSYDIFNKLGIPSHLKSLTRTAIGDYKMENCARLSDLETKTWEDMVVPLELRSRDGLDVRVENPQASDENVLGSY